MKQDSNDLPLPPCKSVYSDSHGDRCVSRAGTRKKREQKTGACSSYSPAIAMDQRSLQEEFKDQFTDVVSRLQSKQLFQSDWDIASFAVFFIFIGMVLLLVVLVLIRCCCCCCCDEQPRRHKVGHENFGMET
ncbi:small integral membrane protein 22 isoform X1 [Oncorhynchus kisutch]|uniref:small integral membrane protein 22 isoform X1 n=1 Tax=Oncorhynchus kisutch TaxID=8019 RepID=UPI0012DC488B|nr:small integral membrane protein 22 isoform X1 [Oncorhynchus kisutch]